MTQLSGSVVLEIHGNTAHLILNRPEKLNAMTVKMDEEINSYIYEINNNLDKDKCIKVNSKNIGNYMFIPNQFKTQKYLTNAYNIDYNRIINPWTIY